MKYVWVVYCNLSHDPYAIYTNQLSAEARAARAQKASRHRNTRYYVLRQTLED